MVTGSCLHTGSVALQPLSDVIEESCRYFKTADGRCTWEHPLHKELVYSILF